MPEPEPEPKRYRSDDDNEYLRTADDEDETVPYDLLVPEPEEP